MLLGVAAVFTFLLSLHFGLTFLYLAPLNPIKVAFWEPVQLHLRDLFAHNWSLFAPEPLHNNTVVFAQCRLEDGRETDWYNISSGMVEGLHRNPMGPYVRLARLHLAALRFYQGHSDPSSERMTVKICATDPDNPVCNRQDPKSEAIKELGKRAFARLGSLACAQVASVEGRGVSAVRLMVLSAPVRPFSQRENPEWKPTFTGLETEWFDYDQVAPLPFRIIGPGDDE